MPSCLVAEPDAVRFIAWAYCWHREEYIYLGIRPSCPARHAHRTAGVLVKMLSRRDLRVQVSPISGITCTHMKAARDAYEPITGWVH